MSAAGLLPLVREGWLLPCDGPVEPGVAVDMYLDGQDADAEGGPDVLMFGHDLVAGHTRVLFFLVTEKATSMLTADGLESDRR